jgi:hypothetical protein
MLLSDPTALEDEISPGNLLTSQTTSQLPKILTKQGFQDIVPDSCPAPSTLSVIDRTLKPRTGRKPSKVRRTRRAPGKRGPKGSTSLEWHQVKQVTEFWHRARTVRSPLNNFVTFRAPKTVSDAEGKRIISRRIA